MLIISQKGGIQTGLYSPLMFSRESLTFKYKNKKGYCKRISSLGYKTREFFRTFTAHKIQSNDGKCLN